MFYVYSSETNKFLHNMNTKELWFQSGRSGGFTSKEKIVLLLWRFVDFWLFQPSLTIFSPWRIFLLRLFGAKIGNACYISPKAKIFVPWKLQMGSYSSIDDYAILARDVGRIILGDYVSISMGVHIVPGGHDIRSRGFENNATFVKIENGAFLGADSFVGRGVTIGQFSVLGSRAAAYKDVPENSVAVGCPAKVIGERIPHDEYIKYRYSMK